MTEQFTRADGITLEKYMEKQLAAMEKATTLAAGITKVELAAICSQIERLEMEVRDLRESRAELAGKASQTSVIVSYILAIVSLVMAIVMKFL